MPYMVNAMQTLFVNSKYKSSVYVSLNAVSRIDEVLFAFNQKETCPFLAVAYSCYSLALTVLEQFIQQSSKSGQKYSKCAVLR